MSALITTKLVTRAGTIGGTTTANIVDRAGNLKESTQFLVSQIVDYSGNIGQITATGPWEMQSGTVETVGSNNGTISANFSANTANPTLSTFLSAGCTGYLSGIVSNSGVWTIQAGPQTIGGVSYAGNGLLIATGANTHTGTINMQAGTNLQLGANCSNTATMSKGNLTIGAAATCTQFTAHTATTYVSQALTNNGTYNITGCGVCGQGGLTLATTVANNGTINIDKAMWRNQSTWSGTGTVNVLYGGTFQLAGNAIGSTTLININGCGWKNASCVEQGALNATTTGFAYQARVNVQSAACIKTNQNVNVEFAGLLTGSAPLTVSNLGTPKPNGITQFTNTGNTYSGTMTVDGTTISQSTGNSLQFAKIVLANGGRISTNVNSNQVIGSLASSDPTTYWSNGDFTINTIRANGVTTYAGRLLWNGGTNTSNIYLNGGPENELTLTGTGNTATVLPRNGARLILQGATFTGTQGQVRASTGATVSAGTSITASVSYLYIDGTSKLEVKAAGAGTSLITATLGFVPTAGWTVDAVNAMAPGTYPIVKYFGTATATLPTIGTNLSGRSVSFAYNNAVNPKILNMILS